MIDVQVLQIRPVEGTSRPLKAFADVKVGDWEIYEWRIVKQEGQRA